LNGAECVRPFRSVIFCFLVAGDHDGLTPQHFHFTDLSDIPTSRC
jgi:hypothetical protein